MDDPNYCYIKSLPLITAWGIWLARNHATFEDLEPSSSRCAYNVLSILDSFPQHDSHTQPPNCLMPTIQKNIPWAFFNGATQGSPTRGGVGGIIYLVEYSTFSFTASLSEATNNFSEFLALKLLVLLAKEKGISQPNIYGDSIFVINYMNGTHTLHNYTIQPMLDDIKRTLVSFSHITFSHVYKEWNKEVDQLSKVGLDLDQGIWKFWEKGPQGSSKFLHNSWLSL
jgi:ribonuclease HI